MSDSRREPYHPLLKSYPDSERVNAVSIGAETLFTRLISASDDLAHYYADPKIVCGKLFTMRAINGQVRQSTIKKWIGELAGVGLIELYEVNGKPYLEIVNCRRNLRNDVSRDIRFPTKPAELIEDPGRSRDDGVTEQGRSRDESGPLNNTKQHNTKQLQKARRVGPDLPPGFVRFWASWPTHFRKADRKHCAKAWEKEELEARADSVLAGLERCKSSRQWQKANGEFIPAPLAWLNKSGWETPGDVSAPGGADALDVGFVRREPTPEDLAVVAAGDDQ